MFGKTKHVRATKLDTWVGRRTEITGTVRFSGALHVDGVIRGDVSSLDDGNKDVLSISQHGLVEGEVTVANVVVNGTVTGDIHAGSYLELAAKSRVNGDVHYDTIEMARGAQVNGSLVRRHADSEVAPGADADSTLAEKPAEETAQALEIASSSADIPVR